MKPIFPTDLESIYQRVESIDPIFYARNRNFVDGSLSYLSPYISRGVISTKNVLDSLIKRGYEPSKTEKFVQELAWRDYWQQVWIEKKSDINFDLKLPQINVENHAVPKALINADTGIEAIDTAIKEYYQTGYLHNHLRMYIAAIACNVAKSHWKEPARWMYYHLLDADWASNALSWQWVAGANSHKKYVANQENINKYTYSAQRATFLDIPYTSFENMPIPAVLQTTTLPSLQTNLPAFNQPIFDQSKPFSIYNFYNLDPEWRKTERVNRVLLLEPSHFELYPISDNSLHFMLAIAKNIPNIQIYVGEFSDFKKTYTSTKIYYKEHPLNYHYEGEQDERDWLFKTKGYFASFFAFWNKAQKEIKNYRL